MPLATGGSFDDLNAAQVTDAELIALLRGGDRNAYEALWSRHVTAALRLARRMAPQEAEDIVSEAFLATYDQIAVRGQGPDEHFRAYLFTVIRNLALRTAAARTHVLLDDEINGVAETDGLSVLEEDNEAGLLLRSFRALPQRWQRILWLSEVENAPRPEIAKQLHIKPNAVTALHRRAKAGLRLQWLTERLPPDLRGDLTHVAADLPATILDVAPSEVRDRVATHLISCKACAELDTELRDAYRSSRSRTLAGAGFAALGIGASATATTLWGGATAAALVAAAAAIAVGSAAVLAPAPTGALTVPAAQVIASEATDDGPLSSTALPSPPTGAPPASAPPAPQPPTTAEPDQIDFWVPATPGSDPRPTPIPPAPASPGTVPGPSMPTTPQPTSAPTPVSASPTPMPSSGLQTPTVTIARPSSDYLAPVLSGSTEAGTTVAVEVGTAVYTAPPAADGGWVFDLRTLGLPPGDRAARVWSFRAGESSPATDVSFSIAAIAISGIPEDVLMDLEEARTSGLIFTAAGPPSGSVCVSADTGQSAVITLDADGTTTRRLRMLTSGLYAMTFEVCDGDYSGPSLNHALWVAAGVFDPWGGVPEFEIVGVDE